MSKYQPSVTTPNQILHDPTNSSPAQFQFSFAKSDRFPQLNSYCNNLHYNAPQVQSKRSTSFGYGVKSDFTKSSVMSPSPALYNQESDFDRKRSITQGQTFGLSRDSCDQYGYIPQHIQKHPGIGSYDQHVFLGNDAAKYTMRKQTEDPHRPVFLNGQRSFMEAPGPGTYQQIEAINQDGKFKIAQFRDSGAPIINPPSSKRFPNDKYGPGPGDYAVKNSLDKDGKYVLSQFKGQGTRPFDHEVRKFFTDSAIQGSFTPGPGNYRLPSNFGHYDHIQGGSISTRSFRNTTKNFDTARTNKTQNDDKPTQN